MDSFGYETLLAKSPEDTSKYHCERCARLEPEHLQKCAGECKKLVGPPCASTMADHVIMCPSCGLLIATPDPVRNGSEE